MRKSFSTSKKIYYVTICALLIFALSIVITGSWFTDSGSIKGDLTEPIIQPKVVYKNGSSYTAFGDSFYWSTDSDNKEVYIQFDTKNTVKNQICRVTYSITWGTLENGVWTPKDFQPKDSLSLSPVNFDTSKWKKGVNTLGSASSLVDAYLTENGITADQLDDIGMTREEVIASVMENLNNPIIRYYYNSVVNIENATYLKICDGFSFDENYTLSDYAGLTAKISFMVEADAVSDTVIGDTGYWMYDTSLKSYLDDRPTNELVNNWKNSI